MPDDFGQQPHETICCPDKRVLTFKLIVSANWILVLWEGLAYRVREPSQMEMAMNKIVDISLNVEC